MNDLRLRPSMRSTRRQFLRQPTLLGCAALAVLFACGGCSGESRPECHPVRGQVLLGKDPVVEAVVVFHNAVEPDRPVPAPTALTDSKGQFSLSTFGEADGAPAGEYAITVVLREPRMIGEEMVRDGKNLLPARYAQPKTSELSYRVVPGPNEVPTLVLVPR